MTISKKIVCLSTLLVTMLVLAIGSMTHTTNASGIVADHVDIELLSLLDTVLPAAPIEVVIVFDDMSATSEVAALANEFYAMQTLPMAGAILPAGLIDVVAALPGVDYIVHNQPLEYFLAESVSYVKADQVWTTYGEKGGGDVAAAVIDSGIDGLHPDMGNVVQNVKVLPLLPPIENFPQTDTTSGHGTHVAGTIGGDGTFSGGHYRGIAPEVDLVGLGSGEAISILTAAEAYDWVLTNHAEYNIRVINNSWGISGGDFDPQNPINVASRAAYEAGILSVFAAGNDGGNDIMNPYSIAPWVLAVAAGDKSGNLAGFSSRGKSGDALKHPDLTAPGVDIYAARSSTIGITALDTALNPVDVLWTPFYTKMSGTSMATPHVVGAAALLFSSNPDLSPDQVMDLLVTTTNPMNNALHEAGSGYMDVLAAYEASLNVTGNLADFLNGNTAR